MSRQIIYEQRLFFTLAIFFTLGMFQAKGSDGYRLKKGPSLTGATGWLNTQALTLEGLRGKVVLIHFGTYTCINWIRTLPYVRAWASKYKGGGLVVIGVHTPEFSFEKKPENVNRAIKEMGIGFPVAMDNNYKIWDSFHNQYWPAIYLMDTKGRIRYQKFGEEEYEKTERQIHLLLNETNAPPVPHTLVSLKPQAFEAAADWNNLNSAETYLIYNHGQFVSPEEIIVNQSVLYSTPKAQLTNQWGLSGKWIIGQENARLNKGTGKVIYRFHARDLHLVMGPATEGVSVRFRVLIDGQPPGQAHGLDIDSAGFGVVNHQRLYQLIRQQGVVLDREFQIEFIEPKVEVYAFTFG